MSTFKRLAAALMLLLAAAFGLRPAQAQDLQPVPELSGRVIDRTATLTPDQQAAIERKLADFEASAGPQIAILIVANTQPEDIASYAYRVADAWKIGRREVGDGLLIVVAKDDRRVRIEVAKALEGAVPDLAARQIIDQAVKPAFREGDYAGGLNAAVDGLIARVKGEGLPAPERGAGGERGAQWQEFLMFFFIGVPIVAAVFTGVLGRKLGAVATGGAAGGVAWWMTTSALLGAGAGIAALVIVGLFGIGASRSIASAGSGAGRMRRGRSGLGVPVILGSGGWSGGGGGFGGGGGGGFSSGGGGDFGGGGASGDW